MPQSIPTLHLGTKFFTGLQFKSRMETGRDGHWPETRFAIGNVTTASMSCGSLHVWRQCMNSVSVSEANIIAVGKRSTRGVLARSFHHVNAICLPLSYKVARAVMTRTTR